MAKFKLFKSKRKAAIGKAKAILADAGVKRSGPSDAQHAGAPAAAPSQGPDVALYKSSSKGAPWVKRLPDGRIVGNPALLQGQTKPRGPSVDAARSEVASSPSPSSRLDAANKDALARRGVAAPVVGERGFAAGKPKGERRKAFLGRDPERKFTKQGTRKDWRF